MKRPGKHERAKLRAKQETRKAIVKANIYNPPPPEPDADAYRADGKRVNMGYAKSSANRNNLLGNVHTMGMPSSRWTGGEVKGRIESRGGHRKIKPTRNTKPRWGDS